MYRSLLIALFTTLTLVACSKTEQSAPAVEQSPVAVQSAAAEAAQSPAAVAQSAATDVAQSPAADAGQSAAK